MAGNKYMALSSGKKVLTASSDVSAGAGDAGNIVALDSAGQIDPSMLPGLDVTNLTSFEDLAAGDYVNLFLDVGITKARKADNSNNRPAHGYVKDTVVAPALVNVYFESANSNVSGKTIGVRQFLGTTGSTIETPLDPTNPADDGKLHQLIGIAITATEINTDIQDCIIL